MLEQDPVRSCGLWREAHTTADFLTVTVTCQEPTLEQSIPDGLYPMEGIHVGAVFGELQHMGS